MSQLSDISKGQSARIVCYRKDPNLLNYNTYKRQLLTMGLTPNTIIKVIRRAPMGDPIQVSVRDYCLSLRKSEAALLEVELL